MPLSQSVSKTSLFFFFNDTATTEISTLSLHDALPILVEQTAQELVQQHGGRATGHACDVRQPEAVEQMIEAIWADGGALTGLVNNAAGNFVSRTEDLSMRAFDAVANIVMRGSFNLTLECGRRWLAEGRKARSEEHTSELQSQSNLVCRLLLEKKKL